MEVRSEERTSRAAAAALALVAALAMFAVAGVDYLPTNDGPRSRLG